MKRKTKTRILILGFTLFFLFSFLINGNNVKGADNYSNYLYQQNITIVNDKAMILFESAEASNNYRNYFESGFIFPAKLSGEMFNAYATDNTRYSFNQVYLNNLNSDYAFSNSNSSENLYLTDNIIVNETDIVNGTIINQDVDIYKTFTINPNDEPSSNWRYTSGSIHDCIDDYPSTSVSDSIYAMKDFGDDDSYKVQDIEFDDLDNDDFIYKIYKMDIMLYSNGSIQEFQNNLTLRYYDNNDWSIDYFLDTTYLEKFHNITISDINLRLKDINNFKIKLIAPQLIDSFSYVCIPSLQIKLYGFYNMTSIQSTYIGSGTFPAEYSFTDDDDYTNPADFTVSEPSGTSIHVISELDYHSKVVEFNDTTTSQFCSMKNTFSSKASGTIEFWIRTTEISGDEIDLSIMSGSGYATYMCLRYNNWYYYSGSWQIIPNVPTPIINTWYHVSIDFECGSGGYKGLGSDKWNVTVNGISSGQISFHTIQSNVDNIFITTCGILSTNKAYIDAIDYSWSSGYYFNRNYESDYYAYITLEKEFNIEYYNNPDYRPVFLDLYFSFCHNIETETSVSIYNYDIENYPIVITNNYENELHIQSFRFNESGQWRFNKFKFNMTSEIKTTVYNMYIENIIFQITYVKPNTDGFHAIGIKFLRYSGSYKGYMFFRVEIYKTYFRYSYYEYNTDSDDYEIAWVTRNIDDFQTFEINIHCRYGLNTLDIEITNILAEIYIDGIQELSFLEQDRKYFGASHYRPEFNYTCYNRNYLNQTGIIGNYSYNCLKGIRCLAGEDNEIYNRFFTVPLFQEQIDISQRIITQGTIDIDDEPEPPKGASYWTYDTFRLVGGTTYSTNVGNWTVDFTPISVQKYTAKFYYNPESYKKTQFGDWTFKIGSWKVSFNFLRDAICKIVNLILLFFQYLLYLVVASLSYIFMFLGCYIVAFLYNVCVYYIYIGLCYVVWFLWVALLWLWEVILWIWANIIYPILVWCYQVLLPLIAEAIIIIMAMLIALFIYVLTLGQVNLMDTYYMVKDILWLIVYFIIDWITIFAMNMDSILLFVLWYIINAGLIYFRYVYSRARGNINRAEQLYYTFQIYISPFVFIWKLLKKLWESAPEV